MNVVEDHVYSSKGTSNFNHARQVATRAWDSALATPSSPKTSCTKIARTVALDALTCEDNTLSERTLVVAGGHSERTARESGFGLGVHVSLTVTGASVQPCIWVW